MAEVATIICITVFAVALLAFFAFLIWSSER